MEFRLISDAAAISLWHQAFFRSERFESFLWSQFANPLPFSGWWLLEARQNPPTVSKSVSKPVRLA
jgi:hypothetical protein